MSRSMTLTELASRPHLRWRGLLGVLLLVIGLASYVTPVARTQDEIGPVFVVQVHDEIDLGLGTLRLKVGGGHGGHNGMRSIIQELGTQEFVRVRVGVGRPGPAGKSSNVAGFVLDDFAKSERTEVDIVIKEAADAIEDVIQRGPLLAMNKWNGSTSKNEK